MSQQVHNVTIIQKQYFCTYNSLVHHALIEHACRTLTSHASTNEEMVHDDWLRLDIRRFKIGCKSFSNFWSFPSKIVLNGRMEIKSFHFLKLDINYVEQFITLP